MTQTDVAVVIPAYNEAQTVAEVVRVALLLTPDVTVASDGSSDDTAAVARLAGARVVELNPNAGKGPALHAALKATSAHCSRSRHCWWWRAACGGDAAEDIAANVARETAP